jgi:hypothetical protein
MMVIVEQLVEWRLTGETEILGENLPPAPRCQPQIPHDQTRAPKVGRRGGKPATNRLSYGATDIHTLSGIRTNDPSDWAGEDISCLRPRAHCYRQGTAEIIS